MTTREGRPLLAFVYDPQSTLTLDVADAARDVCDLLWVIDSSDPATGSMPRLMKRIGSVVDVAGLTASEAARKIGASHPKGILTQADSLIEWTAEVASLLGLRFHSPATALAAVDKRAQRTALREAGLPVPGFWLIREEMTEDDWVDLHQDVSFPAVLKPRRGQGSQYTFEIRSFGMLREQYAALHKAENGPSREFVLEEYIPDAETSVVGPGFGGYVSVESVVAFGEITHLAISGKTPLAEPFRETGMFMPSSLDDAQSEVVLDLATRAARALGIDIGFIHTEIKMTPAGPVVIEVNARIGGDVPELMEPAFGLHVQPLAFKVALGEPVEVAEMPTSDRVYFRLDYQAPISAERLLRLDGLDELKAVAGVDDVVVKRGPGATFDWREGSQGAVFVTAGSTPDHDSLRELAGSIPEIVHAEWA